MCRQQWSKRLCAAAVLALAIMIDVWGQEPTPPPSSAAASEAHPAVPAKKNSKKKYSHAEDFLIRGTVFNEKALAFPGVELRIRVAGQKKYRWETYTNSRGEFAVRVPQGAEYEMLVHAKGYVDQSRAVDAKSGGNEEAAVFRMQPLAGGQK